MYKKTTLENGIRIVTDSMPAVRSIAMSVLIEAGPRDETPEQSGLAHLVEHGLFQGTSGRDATEIARVMDAAGGQMGGFTTRDYTCFTATVLDDYRTYALDLLGDILLNSIFPPDKLEKEKQAILCEIETARDMPHERAHALLKASAWKGHPLGRPIAGRPETVRSLTREDVIYFVHKHYLPNRMILAAAGHVEHEDFEAQARDAFWQLMGQSPATLIAPPQMQASIKIEHMPVSQTYFSLGFRGYPYAHPNRYAMHVFSNIFGGGISSRLFRRMREERGMVYEIGSEYNAYGDDGLLVVEGRTSPEYFRQVFASTLMELWKLISGVEPIDEEELWKAKMHLQGQHLIAAENTSTRMGRLATQELYFGRYIPGREILEQIADVDLLALQRLADEYLIDAFNQITVTIVGPETSNPISAADVEEILNGFKT